MWYVVVASTVKKWVVNSSLVVVSENWTVNKRKEGVKNKRGRLAYIWQWWN